MPAAPVNTVPLPHSYGVNSANRALKLPLPSGHYPLSIATFNGTVAGTQSGRDLTEPQRRQIKQESPLSRGGPHTALERAQKKKSVEDNSIVPSLQIPSTINDSKGSLAEFAAQVTIP